MTTRNSQFYHEQNERIDNIIAQFQQIEEEITNNITND